MANSQFQDFETKFKAYIQTQYAGDRKLYQACRYALEGEGKKTRPQLCYLFANLFGRSKMEVFAAACAVEMIHTYSLVHDDMPCMDDDDIRRGRETVHKKYDEATALLVGDALQTDAFARLRDLNTTPQLQLQAQEFLGRASGSRGMILGQSLDLYWTDRNGATIEDLQEIHRLKTGALLGASCALGTLCSQQPNFAETAFDIGLTIGLAFQIIDDCLDDTSGTGKSQGKDRDQNKLTYLRFMSRDKALNTAEQLTLSAFARIPHDSPGKQGFESYANSLLSRKK